MTRVQLDEMTNEEMCAFLRERLGMRLAIQCGYTQGRVGRSGARVGQAEKRILRNRKRERNAKQARKRNR